MFFPIRIIISEIMLRNHWRTVTTVASVKLLTDGEKNTINRRLADGAFSDPLIRNEHGRIRSHLELLNVNGR